MWSQALTIALVVASGIGGFITTLSAVDSLALARDRFYAQGRFADVFASVKRAPTRWPTLLRTCRAWPMCRPPRTHRCASRSTASPIRSSAS